MSRSALYLPYRTVLHGQYAVGRGLGDPGGSGITYLGWDLSLHTAVAIKECLPGGLVERNTGTTAVATTSEDDRRSFSSGLEAFLREARVLASLDHPNIVRVRTFFEANNTAYLVMDHLDGIALDAYLSQRGGRLDQHHALRLMLPILDALEAVHDRGLLHRDVKPQNIFITADCRPVLLDFGSARALFGETSRSLTVQFTPGFAPYEQYLRRGEQGPWTDVYSAAATLYNLITGIVPENAIEREVHDMLVPPARLFGDISPDLSRVVMKALSTLPSQRHRSAGEFRDELTRRQALAPQSIPSEPDSTPATSSKSRPPLQRSSVRPGLAIAAFAVLTILIVFLVVRDPPIQGVRPDRLGAEATPPVDDRPRPVSDRKPGEVWTDPVTGVEMAWCPPGSFLMGSSASDDETPVHRVTFAHGFWMQTTEVTQGLWKTTVGSDPWVTIKGGPRDVPNEPDCPAIYVTLYDAQVFVNELIRRGGVGYHVPSEAEWEYACRAGSTGMFCFGDDESLLAEYAWYEETAANIGEKFVHPVRRKRPNAWGLYDMHGSVSEWCTDWYHPGYAGAPVDGSPWLKPPTSSYVNRGGCWNSSAGTCRSTNRNDYTPASYGSLVGFRVAKHEPPEAAQSQ